MEVWVQFLTPNQQISHPCHPLKQLISSSADLTQHWNDTINSCMVWTLRSYCFSAGCSQLMVLCTNNMTPCPKAILWTRRRLHWGAIFTFAKHLLAPLWQQDINIMHCFGPASRRVHHRCNIGCCIHGGGKEDNENQYNALILHSALHSLIGINEN